MQEHDRAIVFVPSPRAVNPKANITTRNPIQPVFRMAPTDEAIEEAGMNVITEKRYGFASIARIRIETLRYELAVFICRVSVCVCFTGLITEKRRGARISKRNHLLTFSTRLFSN